MADLERPLSALVDPPLAPPPSLADLEDRARRHRQRRRLGSGAGAALAVVALIAGVVALTPKDEGTVHTASNGGTPAGNAAGPALGQSQPAPDSATVHEFDAMGAHFQVVALRDAAGGVCLTLVGGEALAAASGVTTGAAGPTCWTPDDRPIQAASTQRNSLSYVFGIAAKSVTEVAVTGPAAAKAELFGQAAGYPVNFFGSIVGPDVSLVQVRASIGSGPPFALSVEVHRRISVVNGSDVAAPAAPTTTVARSQEPGSVPPVTPVPTTAPPPTTTPTVTSPPTTAPPTLGIPKLITVTAGASNLNKIRFESAVASGSQALAVRFWAGVEPCTVLGKVDVVESADKVTVTLWTGTTNSLILCTALAQYFETIVPLSAPLGARAVVDGAA